MAGQNAPKPDRRRAGSGRSPAASSGKAAGAGRGTDARGKKSAAGASPNKTNRNKKKKRTGAWLRAALIAILAAGTVIGLIAATRRDVFVLHRVTVEGNSLYTPEEIIQKSGLTDGADIFDVAEDRVRRALAANDITLVSMTVNYPDHVLLVVEEQHAVAAVNCAGVILVLDSQGRIMDRLTSVPEGKYVQISGMDVSLNAQGTNIESGKRWQLDDMSKVLGGLIDRNMLASVAELNVADRYNLYLVSRSGIKIVLGDDEMLSDKLMWAESVLAQLTQEGVHRGILDVSTGKNAVYADR